MLAHHYTTALGLALASGQPTEELEGPARAVLAEAAARALALHSYSAARAFAEEALELRPDDDAEHANLLYLRALAEIRVDDTDEAHLTEARDALLAAGERLKAGAVSVFLVGDLRAAGRPEWAETLNEALAMVEAEESSSEKGWVLARAAWERQFGRQFGEALELAHEALAVGDAVGDEEVRSHALDAMANAKLSFGEDGIPDFERALAAAHASQSPQLMMNALGNMAIAEIERGELERATDVMANAGNVARTYGNRWGVVWAGMWPIELAYLEGRWDEAAGLLEPYLRGEFGPLGHVGMAQNVRGVDARIRLGRADIQGALTASETSLTEVRAARDPRMLPDVLGIRARVLAETGSKQEAAELVEECMQEWEARGGLLGSPAWWLLDVEAACLRLGQPGVLRRIVLHAPYSSSWLDACAAYGDEELEQAAEIYARIGARSEEALARFWAAERLIASGKREEGKTELDRALAFYRQAGATLYLEQTEALMAPSG